MVYPAASAVWPREHETPFNKAPLVRALAALLMAISILATITRIATRLVTVRRLKLDDALITLSTLFCIAQSTVVISQGANGLGKNIDVLNSHQVSSILKGQYAADILYITSLLFAKVSATRTIWQMIPRQRRRFLIAIEILIGFWAVSSIFTSLFQCNLPEPWDYIDGRCFDRTAFWTYFNTSNTVTDLSITGILIEIFKNLKTSVAKKMMVIGVFGSRVFIIPPVVCHIYFFNRVVDTPDPTFDMWLPVIITQVIQCMGIMATCTPFLKPLMDNLESGQMIAGDLRQTKTKSSNSRSKTGVASRQASRNRGASSRGLTSIGTLASNASN